ncbi:GNAT family N-acetyltransferase [Agrobacterium vitis]|uniref:GNAT family N-acetyltransferase n=1 Tax=Agrobacterium vitis TaxID=373 RepID=A0AAE2RET7_AGRVI|nr:GNAT family N-acetyltransferase [Agrobacterium vitis]MBF2716214.1 GNAT family N-acetyltransferase [Agrobacterium vitis]
MSATPPTSILTSRLALRAARPEHADAVFEAYTGSVEASRYLQRTTHASVERTRATMEAWGELNWLKMSRFVWTIFNNDETAIGLLLLFIESNTAEIHYGIGQSHWGQCLVTEAGIAVMDWIVNTSTLPEVTTCCAAEYHASLRALEKIGLERAAFLPASLFLSATNTRKDAWLYRWKRVAR